MVEYIIKINSLIIKLKKKHYLRENTSFKSHELTEQLNPDILSDDILSDM